MNNLFHENQFGFQINKSTENAILQFKQAILPQTLIMANLH